MLVLESLIQLNPTLGIESSLGQGKGRPQTSIPSLNPIKKKNNHKPKPNAGFGKRKTQLLYTHCCVDSFPWHHVAVIDHNVQTFALQEYIESLGGTLSSGAVKTGQTKYVKMTRAYLLFLICLHTFSKSPSFRTSNQKWSQRSPSRKT